jgi:hypothetical protein
MKEIWKASHNPSNWQSENTSSLLGIWWFLWIVTNMLGQAVFRMSNGAEELPELINLNLVSQASEVLSIPLALVTLLVVNRVYQAQVFAYASANKSIQPTADASAD